MTWKTGILVMAGLALWAAGLRAQTPEQMGGIYFAYPEKDAAAAAMQAAPEGFKPVYVSHYGRHGSRWPVNAKIYKHTADFFQEQQLAQNLTDEGKAAWKLTTLCAGNTKGHLGELTPMGERQHRGIAERMVVRVPSLFADGARIEARSSTEPRCIMSMAAFCEALKEVNGKLDMRRHATPGDMDFIHHKTEEADMMNSDVAPWRWEFDPYRDSVSRCPALAARLFRAVPDTPALPLFMRSLYDIAISVQDIDGLEADLLSLFSADELKALWKAANYIQYVGNGRSPLSGSSGPQCVGPLLDEIITRADEMLESGDVAVDLRFGHDTDLLRLVSLMGIDGYGIESEDIDDVASRWPNYSIAPMAANLQLIFYRDASGQVLVQPLLNEHPARISGLDETAPGFYSWPAFKARMSTPSIEK